MEGRPSLFRLSGWFIAFDNTICPRGTYCRSSVVVINARTNRTRNLKAPLTDPSLAELGISSASSLVLSSSGAVAWIRDQATGRPTDLPPIYEVVVALHGEDPQVVSSGESIDRFSLALGGGRIYWTDGDQPRSAPMP